MRSLNIRQFIKGQVDLQQMAEDLFKLRDRFFEQGQLADAATAD